MKKEWRPHLKKTPEALRERTREYNREYLKKGREAVKKLKIAIDALENCISSIKANSNHYYWNIENIAQKALEQIRGID